MLGAPVPRQKSMEPEACASRFRTTHPSGACRETPTAFSVDDFVKHTLLLPCGHGARARLLPMPCGAAELPGFFTECKSYKQGPLWGVLLHVASR